MEIDVIRTFAYSDDELEVYYKFPYNVMVDCLRYVYAHELKIYLADEKPIIDQLKEMTISGVENAIESLVPGEREVILLYYQEGYSKTALAKLICLTPDKVMQLRKSALKELSKPTKRIKMNAKTEEDISNIIWENRHLREKYKEISEKLICLKEKYGEELTEEERNLLVQPIDENNPYLSMDISLLDLSTRIRHALALYFKNEGINEPKIKDLMQLGPGELLSIRNIGVDAAANIIYLLWKYKLDLPDIKSRRYTDYTNQKSMEIITDRINHIYDSGYYPRREYTN